MGHKGIPFLFIIDYEMNNPEIFPISETAKSELFFDIKGCRNYTESISDEIPLKFCKYPLSYSSYLAAFNTVLRQIHLGKTFLLNLTFPTEIESNWTLRRIFEKSKAPYKLLFKNQFVLFSPESFVKIANGVISSFPMKGTIDKAVKNAAEVILSDEKEKAEHATIVDLIRNDLSIVAQNVRVEKYRYLEEINTHTNTLLQVSSKICGNLASDYQSNLGTIVTSLLPAGSICGAPKESTLKIIRQTENYNRGYYTGVFGVFDGTSLDSAVMIRFIEQANGKLYYKSGGGITNFSDPEKEYRELIDKVYVPAY